MNQDTITAVDGMGMTASMDCSDVGRWQPKWRVEKRHGDWSDADIAAGRAEVPYEVVEFDGNLLTTNGANVLWTALTGVAITAYSNANANLGVGDSAVAEAAGQTDLQAAINKLRKGMVATYPVVTTNQIEFRASFATAEANFVWNEFAAFNAATGGTMLNRKVQNLGTKASGTWTLILDITLT